MYKLLSTLRMSKVMLRSLAGHYSEICVYIVTIYHFPKLLCNLFVTCYMSSQTQFLACNCPGTAWLFDHIKRVTVYVRLLYTYYART